MNSVAIDEIASLPDARDALLAELGDWVTQCVHELSGAPPLDGHDQGTFTASWPVWIWTTGDEQALAFMKRLQVAARAHFTESGAWRHGYWADQEVHHGTEHFDVFMRALWRLNPADGEVVAQFTDAAEHLGNWAGGVPEWFDPGTGLFRSMYLGTEAVWTGPGYELNVPEHLRCVNMALLAHEMTDEFRYLDLAERHGGLWADAVLAERRLPVGLAAEGPVYTFADPAAKAYRGFAGQMAAMESAVDRAENFLASGGTQALLRLWERTGERRFREAAGKLIRALVTQLIDPDAGPAAHAVRLWRRTTGDTSFDEAVLSASGTLEPFAFAELTVEPDVQRDGRPSGVGKRTDMPRWYEDGRPRTCNPILLAVAAEVTGDDALAARALCIAHAYLRLAREAFPHGREHGCSARSVSAVVRGHGRNNGAGVATGVLEPLMDWPGRIAPA